MMPMTKPAWAGRGRRDGRVGRRSRACALAPNDQRERAASSQGASRSSIAARRGTRRRHRRTSAEWRRAAPSRVAGRSRAGRGLAPYGLLRRRAVRPASWLVGGLAVRDLAGPGAGRRAAVAACRLRSGRARCGGTGAGRVGRLGIARVVGAHGVIVVSSAPARRRCRRARSRFTSSGAREARTDIRGQLGQLCVGEVVGGAHGGVLPGQPGPEQQRVVGAERDRGAGGEQRRAAAPRSGRSRRRARRWRPGRPPARRRPRRSGRAAPGPRRRGRRARAGRRAGRRGRSGRARARAARRRAGPAAARPARRSRRRRRSRRCVPRRSSLESPKPTTPRPAYCAASRARVRASSGCRVRLAAITTAIPRPVARRGVADGVEHQVGEGGDPAEARGVPAGVDLDLQPPAAVADVVLGGLAHQPAYVVLGAQHRPGDVVEPLEAEPALLVGRRQLRRPLLDQRVGQRDAVALGELEQRRVPHRPGEVQVQVRLRQVAQVARRPRALRRRASAAG